MKISGIDIYHANAGWRPWSFIKISTSEGLVGWSECSDSHGSPKGIEGVINGFKELLIGEDPLNINKILFHIKLLRYIVLECTVTLDHLRPI